MRFGDFHFLQFVDGTSFQYVMVYMRHNTFGHSDETTDRLLICLKYVKRCGDGKYNMTACMRSRR